MPGVGIPALAGSEMSWESMELARTRIDALGHVLGQYDFIEQLKVIMAETYILCQRDALGLQCDPALAARPGVCFRTSDQGGRISVISVICDILRMSDIRSAATSLKCSWLIFHVFMSGIGTTDQGALAECSSH